MTWHRRAREIGIGYIAAAILVAWASVSTADEAPTILIEDVILTCPAQSLGTSMPSTRTPPADERIIERRIHRDTAQFCKGKSVCRIAARALMTSDLRNSTCDDVTIVPVCAAGDFITTLQDASTEMTLDLRETAQLVINCSGAANPHF